MAEEENLAELYRRRVEGRHANLNKDDSRAEAADIVRGLIETIRVRNADDGLEIELVGEIVNMIELDQTTAHKRTAASKEAAVHDVYRSSVKVVAGARNCLNLLLHAHCLISGSTAS